MTIDWGTDLSKTHLDDASDDPSQARAELEAIVDRLNTKFSGETLLSASDVLLADPEHATDGGTDAYASATNTTPPAGGVIVRRDFQSANTTTTPTLDSLTITTKDGSALWANALEGVHELQMNAGGTEWLVLDPRVPALFSDATRAFYSTEHITHTVGSGQDFETLQEALDVIPLHVLHTITINVDAGDYTGEGTLIVPPFYAPRMKGDDPAIASETDTLARVVIEGQGANPEDVKVHSMMAAGGGGQINLDMLKYHNVIETKFSNENAQVEIHDDIQCQVKAVDFENDTAGVGSGSSAVIGEAINAYGGRVTINGPCVVTGNADGYTYAGRAKNWGLMDWSGSSGSIDLSAANIQSVAFLVAGATIYYAQNNFVGMPASIADASNGGYIQEYTRGELSGRGLFGVSRLLNQRIVNDNNDDHPFYAGRVDGNDGSIDMIRSLFSGTRTGTGLYTITHGLDLSQPPRGVIQLTPHTSNGDVMAVVSSTGADSFDVKTKDSSTNSNVDANFFFTLINCEADDGVT